MKAAVVLTEEDAVLSVEGAEPSLLRLLELLLAL